MSLTSQHLSTHKLSTTFEALVVVKVAIFELHVLYHDGREIDVGDVGVSLLVHVLTEH